MSRIPTPTLSRKATTVLALLNVGGSYRYVIAAGSTGGGNGAGSLRVTDSGTIPASDAKALESLRSKAGGGAAFVQVIRPDATIVRSAPPKLTLDGTPEQVGAALSLVAEAELPSTIPAHRRAAGVLRAGHAHAVYAVGWIGPEGSFAPGAVAVPAIAALAALHRLTGAPDGIALLTDQPAGVVAMVAAGKGESPRLFVRVLRDDAADSQAFNAVRDEALADAQADLDLDAPVAVGGSLYLPHRLPSGIGLAGEEKLSEFALVLGAAAAAIEPKADEQPLYTMTDRSPTAGRSIITRVVDGLSTPKAAGVTAAACVVLMLGGWLLAAPAKLAILQSRLGGDTSNDTKALQQHEWYKSLREKRWPMTALLAELTSGAPEGVRIESVTIEQNRPVTVTGTAETADSLDKWRASLQGKIFAEVTPNIPDESASPIRFTITAKVSDAMAAAVSELKPVAVSDSPHAPRSDSGGSRTDSSRTDRNARPGGNNGRTNGRTNGGGNGSGGSGRQPTPSGSGSSPAPAATAPPPPISDAQIERLDKSKAMLEWAARQGYLARSDIDAATRTRLEHERDRISARRKALEGGGQ